MSLKLRTDEGQQGGGFLVKYQQSKCVYWLLGDCSGSSVSLFFFMIKTALLVAASTSQ